MSFQGRQILHSTRIFWKIYMHLVLFLVVVAIALLLNFITIEFVAIAMVLALFVGINAAWTQTTGLWHIYFSKFLKSPFSRGPVITMTLSILILCCLFAIVKDFSLFFTFILPIHLLVFSFTAFFFNIQISKKEKAQF